MKNDIINDKSSSGQNDYFHFKMRVKCEDKWTKEHWSQ